MSENTFFTYVPGSPLVDDVWLIIFGEMIVCKLT